MSQVRVPFLFALILAIVFAVGMALLPHPPQVIDVGDKWQHMAAFGTLTMLALLALPAASPWRIGERLSFLGALIEVLQAIPALHRDCDVMDWVADTVMIVAVILIAQLVRAMMRPRTLRRA